MLSYYTIVQEFNCTWKRILRCDINPGVLKEDLLQELLKQEKVASFVYTKMIQNSWLLNQRLQRWERRLKVDLNMQEFQCKFQMVFNITNHSKLRNFQIIWNSDFIYNN